MAKSGGNAGRGGRDGSRSKGSSSGSEWEGWTTSVWDVRKPGEEPDKKKKQERKLPKARSKPKLNASGGQVITGSFGYGRSTRDEMRDLQRRIRSTAQRLGYRDDDKIPGLGLTIRQLRTNANSRVASEGTMRSVLVDLERRQNRR